MTFKTANVSSVSVSDMRSLMSSHRNPDATTSSRVGSVIRLKRPSMPIVEGQFDSHALTSNSAEFTDLTEAYEDIVNRFSASVGRIEVENGNGNFTPIGSCFLVANSESVRMATAGHMLLELLGPGNSVSKSRPLETRQEMRKARVNFHDSGEEDPTQIFNVRRWIWAHPRWDLLLFDLEATPVEIATKSPLPLEQSLEWAASATQNRICVLGYPMNSNDMTNQPFKKTFELPLAVKRVSLGLCDRPFNAQPPPEEVEDESTIGIDNSTIDHDASTLPGSSGSPVFSLDTRTVIGLHYDGGKFHRSRNRPPPDPNNAVNLPVALLEHELLAQMTIRPALVDGQAPINWSPSEPAWFGRGSLELDQQNSDSFITTSNSPLLQSVVADRPDFRDRIYRSSLLKASDRLIPSNKGARFIRNQQHVPACTAFAVAAAINVQLQELGRTNEPVSEQMLYSMATLHDEWIDDSRGGSSLRGAIKGFYQNGVCLDSTAPLTADGLDWSLSRNAAKQARSITLGAYYRLSPDLLDFQLALNETGAIMVSAHVHSGWTSQLDSAEGSIAPRGKPIGTHAFVILGYVEDGFIIQNSWGELWNTWNGQPGLAHWHYDDWADNLIDAWVLRLAPSTPRAFDLVPKIASQHLLLQSDTDKSIELLALPLPRRFSLIGHVCQIERERIVSDGRLGMGVDSLRETALYLASDKAREKYPTIAFFFHDPLLGRENISKLCAWMIKPFKRHGVYPIHIVYGTDEARTIELRVKHECQKIKQRFGAAEKDLSFYIERRIGQLMQPLIRVFRTGIEEAAQPGNPLWQTLASVILEAGDERHFCAFASGIGHCLIEQLSTLPGIDEHAPGNKQKNEDSNLFNKKLQSLFLLAPSATLEMIDSLDIAEKHTIFTLADKYEPSSQLPGYRGDWIDLTARVTDLDSYGVSATRRSAETRKRRCKHAKSSTLPAASAEANVLNNCLKMFSDQPFKKMYGFN